MSGGKVVGYVQMEEGTPVAFSFQHSDATGCTEPLVLQSALAAAIARAEAAEGSFKNFHRSLCARFDYPHDEKDWRRDQVSLEEHIAKLKSPEVSRAGWYRISQKDWQEIAMAMPLGDEARAEGYRAALDHVTQCLNSDAYLRPSVEIDARRWNEVCDKAWFVDTAGYVYGLREGSFAPTCDEDEVTEAIDAAIAAQQAEGE